MTTIIWHGHACFEIINSKGLRIVIDPHDGRSIGIKPPSTSADIVFVTHEHFDHNAVEVVAKSISRIIRMREGEIKVDGIEAEGITEYHDKEHGRLRGKITIYKMIIDDMIFTHLGDLGRIPPEDVIRRLSDTNVLFIPVGGTYTIGPREAFELAEKIRPNILIPMHYWVPGIMLPLATLEEFLKIAKWPTIRLETNRYDLSRDELPEKSSIIVFKAP